MTRKKQDDAPTPEERARALADAPAPETNAAGIVPDPEHAEIPGLVPEPAPGTHLPERPGKEVSANAHEEEHAPIVGFVDHQIEGTDGLINVHTPGLVLAPRPAAARPKDGPE